MPFAPRAEHAGLYAADHVAVFRQHLSDLPDVADNAVQVFWVHAVVSIRETYRTC